MARQPKRMSGPAQVATGPTTLYTAPSYIPNILTSVVRHIHVSNPSVNPVTLTISIGADAAGTRIFDALTIAATSVVDHFCYYPLTSAQIITASSGTNNVLVLTISGDENV